MSPSLTRACAAVVIVFSLGACGKKESPPSPSAAEGTAASAAAAAGGLGLAFLNGFEGEIGILFKDSAKATKPTPPVSLMIKDNKVRVELPAEMTASKGMGNKAYAVLNAPEKKLYAVLEEKKQVVLIDLDKAGEQLKNFGSGMDNPPRDPRAPPSSAPPKVTKTGRKDTVAGYACEIWDVVPDTGEKLSACVANEGGSWFRLPLTGMPTEHAWALELLDGKHFPLRGVAYDKSGAEKGRAEVTKIEKKTLAATLFEIPAGYKMVDLQQMFAAMGSLGATGGPPMMGKMPPGMPPGMMPPQMGAPRGAPAAPPPKRP